MNLLEWLIRKEAPAASDVHVSSTTSRQRKVPISQNTKLPVTGATLAAQQLNPDDDAAPAKKAFRSLKPNDDGATAHTPFPHDPNVLANMRQDQVPRFLGALTDPGKLPTQNVKLKDLVAMQDRVDPAKVDAIRQDDSGKGKPPVVVGMGGRQVIADGHHRATAAWLDGKDEMPVKFKDLEEPTQALKRYDDEEPLAWEIPFAVAKADPDQQLIFGWASVVEKDGALIIDKQGDAILPEDLEKAAYEFMLNARNHGEMHTMVGTGRCVESMVFTKAKQAALGIDLGMVGWWTGFKVSDPNTWAAHKRGEFPEFSIGGSGRRVPFP